MEKKKRFTRIGVIEGYKIADKKDTQSEIWIINDKLHTIDKDGNVYVVRWKKD